MFMSLYLISCAMAFILMYFFSYNISKKDHDLDTQSATFLNLIFSIVVCFFWYFVMVYFFYTITLKHEKQPHRRSEA